MNGFIDIHAHFVYGVDDGAPTSEVMNAMLDEAHAQGVSTLFATSHATPGVKAFPQETYTQHLAEARQYCASKGYGLTLYPGAEILYSPLLAEAAIEHKLPTLGDTEWVLVEFLPNVSAKDLERALDQLTHCGYSVLVAHIERYACLVHGSLLRCLCEAYPIRCQVNCSTVLRPGGFLRARKIDDWFRSGLVDVVASDMHNAASRPEQMCAAYEILVHRYGTAEADRLTGRDGTVFDGKDKLFGN